MTSSKLRSIVRVVVGVVVAVAGLAHFTHAEFFTSLVPDAFGAHRGAVNIVTGILQTGMGLAFLVPRFRSVARWSTVLLLVATLPPAVDQIIHPAAIEAVGLTPTLAALRVLAQILMIALIWWATGNEPPQPDVARSNDL